MTDVYLSAVCASFGVLWCMCVYVRQSRGDTQLLYASYSSSSSASVSSSARSPLLLSFLKSLFSCCALYLFLYLCLCLSTSTDSTPLLCSHFIFVSLCLGSFFPEQIWSRLSVCDSLSLSPLSLSPSLYLCLLLSRTLWVCAQLHPAYTFVPHAGPDSRKHKGVKPAGQQAEHRSIATLCALRATAEKGFADLDGAWAGGLLQQGHVYRKAGTDDFYVSLGFTFKATLLWRLEKCGVTWVQSESLDPSPPLE